MSTIGLVTITGALGDRFGGLGFFIFEGYRRSFPTEILFGAIPAMILAIAVDLSLVGVQGRMTPWSKARIDEGMSSMDAVPPRRAPRRGRGLMEIIGEVLAWLTDPAHWTGPSGIPVRVAEHLALSLTALIVASAIALPVGLYVGHSGRGARVAVNTANLARAIPSLALIGIAVPITVLIDPQFGFKVLPTLIAMIVLGIPPILVNTYTGVVGGRQRPHRGRDRAWA